MRGYVGVAPRRLPQAWREPYQAVRCGLCHAIRSRFGVLRCVCLSEEVVLLLLLADALADTEPTIYHGSCSVTPLRWVPYRDYLAEPYLRAADVCTIIAEEELADDLRDSPSHTRTLLTRLYLLLTSVPLRAEGIETLRAVHLYTELENQEPTDMDALLAANSSIAESVARDIFCVDDWAVAEQIFPVARALGAWVYLADACDDWHEDDKHGAFNPLRLLASPLDVRRLLSERQQALAHAVDDLPLRRNAALLRHLIVTQIANVSTQLLGELEKELA